METLINYHNHSGRFSACASRLLTLRFYKKVLRENIWGGIGIADHIFQMYFPPKVAWGFHWYRDAALVEKYRSFALKRIEKYKLYGQKVKAAGLVFGIEVEPLADGRFLIPDSELSDFDVVIGSIHYMNALRQTSFDEKLKEFFVLLEQMAPRVDIVGHPFRILLGRRLILDHEIVERTLDIIKRSGAAFEINSHTPYYGVEKVLQLCAEKAIPIAVSTDTHKRREIYTPYFSRLFKDVPYLDKLIFYQKGADKPLR